MTESNLAQEVAYLKDLFQRKLLEDRAKNQLVEAVKQSLKERDDLDKGRAFRDLFLEALVALDRLRTEEPSQGLNESVSEELLEVFARRGLDQVPSTGAFDGRVHQAIGRVPATSDLEPGQIAYVERDGYTLGGQLVRPARVFLSVESE